jgi:tRNA(adenine34) deaminase
MKPRPNDVEIIDILLGSLSSTLESPEVPVAAAIYDSEMNQISHSLNKRESTNDPTAHAEICVIRDAGTKNQNWNLAGFSLFVTLEPCFMCAGAILQSRISRVVIGAFNPGSTSSSTLSFLRSNDLKLEIVTGVKDKECSQLISTWFSNQRLLKG